ncbi:MAG: MarR family transcriptional regulator [Nitrospira sp.]
MTHKAHELHQAIRAIRSCFHQLKALGDELHGDLGVTVAMRAVMESLAEDGEQTVPQIARTKAVSRQHIQINVDELADARLVELQDNPGHKRSPFVVLTKKGRATFSGMRRREGGILEKIAQEFTAAELNQVSDTLTKLKHSIITEREKAGG